MKKFISIIVSILFALSVSGLAFAQAPAAKPAADTVKAEEKAPTKAKKAKKTKKTKKGKKADDAAVAPAPADKK